MRKRLVKRGVNVVDGARRKAGVGLLPVKAPDVSRGQALELDRPQGGSYVELYYIWA